jgi:hypothetical protein
LKTQVPLDTIYTDFNKAFDTVNHNALIQVFNSSGIGELFLSWFSSYLYCHYQWVKLLGVKSNVYLATSGVPQGGHLSPLLFFLLINSISSVDSNSQILYVLKIILSSTLVYPPWMTVLCYRGILITSLSDLIC